jgi:hypothetical protein
MGKTASRFTQALGFGGKNSTEDEPSTPKPPQWDTTIDQLFGDAPPDDNDIEPPPVLDVPAKPRRRRRAPPPPPSMFNRGRRRPLPSSPGARRRRPRGAIHPMRTPIVPDLPSRIAKSGSGGGVHAINAPFGANRRLIALPASNIERDIPARVVLTNNFKRRPSSRRIR